MNKKIEKLWNYLRIENEVLVVAVYNPQTGKDEFVIAEMIDGKLSVTVSESFSPETVSKPLRIIKQRDLNGRFEIPDPDSIEHDRNVDY